MREGIRRLAVAIRWLSWLWIGGILAYWIFGGEQIGDSLGDKLIVAAFAFGPGLFGLGAAWVLEGFAQRPDARVKDAAER